MKVGIITLYYESHNYGGVLQSYALCKKVQDLGYDAEQICFDASEKKVSKHNIKKYFSIKRYISFIKRKVRKIIYRKDFIRIKPNVERFRSSFKCFREKIIAHSERVYNYKNIAESVDIYDAFITGSDQVWNFLWYDSAFFLDFVPKGVPKFSYGASLGMTQLTDEQQSVIKRSLADYTGVSVRENDATQILKNLSPVPIKWVVDPVMLLSEKDWDDIAAERLTDEKYMFCYFLSENIKCRELVKIYAKKHNLKLVFIPYIHSVYRKADDNFGDIQLSDVSPEKFLSLIKHAECVFTDSFHATVFSHIFKKDYFVFMRDDLKNMYSRLISVAELFETEERLCFSSERLNLEYIESLSPVDYGRELIKLEELRKSSEEFLKSNLKKSEQAVAGRKGVAGK